MKRRALLKTATGAAVLAGAGSRPLQARVPAHNWEEHDFGPGPVVPDRLYQGPFPQYAPKDVVPGSDVVMATTPSDDIVPGYGMGLIGLRRGRPRAAPAARGVAGEVPRRPGEAALRPEDLHPAGLARHPEAARAVGPSGALEDHLRPREA